MRIALLLTCATLTLSGCARISDSRINPLNWFGGSTSQARIEAREAQPLRPLVPENRVIVETEGRALVQTVTGLTIDRTPDGAIIRATGQAASQGYFNAQLVLETMENGVATYGFRVEQPAGTPAVGTNASRQITVALVLSQSELNAIRVVRVNGAQNSRTVRR
ncbi:hypothetical protein [Aestuariibius sp. HNIBRBA575]|uniref:hypothetical protein n=1 Tax=Aestuariibius sp. HNIBRBA575 TaxID=3233343 RepID=UPI0034A2FADB